MKGLIKLWLLTKVAGELVALVGMVLSMGFVAWSVFHLIPQTITEVFGF